MNKRKLGMAVAVVFLVNLLMFLLVTGPMRADAAVYKQGSRGDTVTQIQQKLKNWGYYGGKVDGIYGAKTTAAVKWFQRKNKLIADGVTGKATLAALGMPTGAVTSSAAATKSIDLELLARLISAESRGEPYSGQVAVGAVVLNRMRHPSFPGTLSGVIYQNGAFSCLYDGQWNQPVASLSRKAAQDALNGWDPTGGAIYYYNPVTATNQWIRSRPVITRIGRHVFCM